MRKIYFLFMMVFAFTGLTMAQTMENFESLKMNIMLGGAEDQSSFQVVPNPDPSGVNPSAYVVKFVRDKDGVMWDGFYATLANSVDLSVNKYVHVKVWKPRVSPVMFKLEGAVNTEIAPTNPQSLVNEWEDLVFDFSALEGLYSKIVFTPDRLESIALTDDAIIYFDDFLINNDPNPISVPQQTFNVDMSAAGLASGDRVFISGALGGVYGTWNEPGKNANNEMFDTDGDGIYSATLNLPDGLTAFKFFKGTGWGGGDNAPGGDRTISIAGTMDITYKFGSDGLVSETHTENVVMENFESLKMNIMTGGAEDLSKFTVVPNPDKSSYNLSDYVVEFLRDKDGVVWGGFYATLDTPVDFTTNKYVHVKVWKTRMSPVKFKIERADGNIELASMNEQTVTDGWQDMVFDFSATTATGLYSKIVFMPDSKDPVGLTEDMTMYFDDLILNNDPSPMGPPEQVINVDMTGSGLTSGSQVWLSGALGGIYGQWNEPGKNENNEMTDADGDGIYSITLGLPDGLVAFKFFWGMGWANGDNAIPDRTYTVNGSSEVNFKWGIPGYSVTSVKQIEGTSFGVYPNPTNGLVTVQSSDMKGLTVRNILGSTLKTLKFQAVSSKQIDLSDLKSGIYFISVETSNGIHTSKLIKK
jgi:hypothetical protein